MRQMIKKTFALILAISMVLSLVPVSGATVIDGTNEKTVYLSFTFSSDDMGADAITQVAQGEVFYAGVNFAGNPTELADSIQAYDLFISYPADKVSFPAGDDYCCVEGLTFPTYNNAFDDSIFYAGWASEKGIIDRRVIQSSGTLFFIEMQAETALSAEDLSSFSLVDEVDGTPIIVADGRDDLFTIVQAPAISVGEVSGSVYSDATAAEIKNLIQSFSFVDNACAVNTYTSADSEWAGLEVILPSSGLAVGKNTLIARYGNITCDFEITVLDKVASIAITTPPTKTKYGEFEKFDKTGMVVTATYESGATAVVTDDCVVDTTTPLRVTDTSWVVRYGDKTALQPITVTAPKAVINITAPATATRGKEVLVTLTFDHAPNADIGGASANFVYSSGFPEIISANTKITQNTAGWSNDFTFINKTGFGGVTTNTSGGTIVGQLAFRIPNDAAFGTIYTVSLNEIILGDYSNGDEIPASEYTVLNSSASVEVVDLPRVEGINVADYSGVYDGAEHTVSVEIPEGATIKYSSDGTAGSYTLDAPAKFKNAGQHKAYYVVSKEGNSDTYGYGNVSIQAKPLSNSMIAAISPKMYTGSQIMPPVTVTDGSPSIITADDYTVSYGDNINVADGGSVTLTGKGNYKGTATARFDILPITMAVEEVNYNGKYDGAAHSAQVNVKTPAAATVTYGTSAGTYNLAAMPEYTNVGTYTVYYKATAANYEDYTGSVKVVITPKTLTEAMIADIPAFDYTGSQIKPTVTVTDGEPSIITANDYTVSYGANVNVADGGSVTITGTGNYEGTVTKNFVINKIAMTVSSSDYTGVYDGTEHSGTVNVQIPGGATVMYGLSDGVYTDSVMPKFKDVGTNTVYFKATDPNYLDYTGSFNVSITPKNVTADMIASIPDMPYTGSQITPSVTVTDGTPSIITANDYTVEYGTNINVADGGSVKIIGQGNYTGEATKTFTITLIEMTVTATGYTGTYDGAEHGATVVVNKPENGATVMYGTESGTYNLTEMPKYTDAGRYTVYYKATAANYIDNVGSVNVVITPAEVTPTSAVVTDKVYNGASDDAVVTGVEFTGLFGTDALVKDTDYEVVSAVYGDKNVSETVPVTVTVALKNTVKNYVLATNTVSATGKITKATAPALTAATAQTLLSSSIVSGAKEYSFNLAGIIAGIPTDAGTVTYTFKTAGAHVTPVGTGIEGTTLKVNVATAQTAGTTDTVVVTVSSTNYADTDVNVNFEFKDKTPVTVTVNDVNTTYGEEYTVAGRYENQPTTGATWTYEYVGIDGTNYPATDVKPTKAGKYQVTARYEDNVVENDVPGHVGEDTATLTIARKNLTLADGDVAVTKVYDGTTAAGTLTGTLAISSGIVNSDDVTVDMTSATAAAYANANVGTYSVTISGYTLAGADKDNYNIPEAYTFNRATITKQLQSAVTINGSTENITATYGDEMNLTVGGGNGTGAYALVSSDSSILRLNVVNATTWEAEILKAGTVTVTATRQGDANYESSEATEISFVINRKTISDTDFTFDLEDKVFTGSEIKPLVTSTLTSADYEVAYTNNTNVGTATITVTGKGNYEGGVTKNFTITPKTFVDTEFTISGISATYEYTGLEIKPEAGVKWGSINLVKDTDYEVAYESNINVGTATVTLTGKGNYDGTITKTFTITPIEMTVEASGYTGTYDGAAHSGTVNVVKPESGYTVMYGTTSGTYNLAEMPTYTDVGRYTVYYKATAANYIDNTGSVEIVITPAEVTPTSAVVTDKVYNGASDDAVVTGVEFTGLFGTDALVKDTDYEIVSAVYGDKNVSETVPVTVTVALKNTVKNYVLATNTVSATGKITKATAPALTAATAQTLLSSSIVSGAKEYSFNLAGIISGIPTDAGAVTYTFKTAGAHVTPVGTGIEGTTLKVNVAEPKTAGTTDTVVVTVSSANYADADVTVRFEFKDKTPVTVTVNDVNTTYGEEYTVAGRYENQPTTGATWTYEYVGIDGTNYPATDVKPTKAGKYQVTARYEDNVVENDVPGHVGEDTATLTIARKNLTLVDGDVAVTKVYDGTTAAGTLTGTLAIGSGIVTGDDVTVDMTSATAAAYANANVGTYSVTISGYTLAGADKDNYNIPETYTFNRATITKQLQSTVTINGSTDNITATYGDEMNIVVGGGNGTGAYALVSSDSSILRLNAINATTWEAEILKAGTVTVTATRQGDANYEASEATEISFVINRKTISDTDFTFDLEDKVFTGSEIKPQVTSTLTSADYEVAYTNNTNVGTATITVTGNGNYEGGVTKNFTITPKTFVDTEFTVSGISATYEYTGSEIKPEAGVKWGSINLVKDTDYEVAYESNINVGTATVTITGKGNYDGTITKTFEITPAEYTGTVDITANTAIVEVGTVLTANAPAAGTLSYQWKRNGVDISDADADTYTVTLDDAGADISVAVTSAGNYAGTLTSGTVTVGKVVLTGTVTIAGTTDITATIENAPSEENYKIVWLRDGVEISNATATTYTITNADKGCEISAKLVAVGNTYTGEILSNALAIPAEAPSFVQNPTATAGNASITVGFIVSANGSAITNYKIYVDGSEVATLTGDQTSYLITGLTNGTTYTVTVEAINGIGSTVSAPVTATPVVYSGGGGGGGGAAAPAKYTIKFVTNGGTSIADVQVEKNDKLPSVAVPEKEGYTFEGWYTDSALTKLFDADTAITKSFTLYAKWTEKTDDGKDDEPTDTPEVPEFTDVKPTAYFYDAVKWAVENNVTSGTGANEFSPNDECTRAQMVTFLWRAAGSPKADNTNNPFGDVSSDKYYYDAVVWALENGITSGISATEFNPDGKVSRAQSVTFLWRLAGAISGDDENPFSDVSGSAYYGDAVAWAVANNVTYGLTATSFGPNDVCTRAQIVTFIFRHFVK